MSTSSYATFGSANPLTREDIDPVHQCVGNDFFTKSGIPGENQEVGLCDKFMGRRCGLNWDIYCEQYLLTGLTDMGGFNHFNKKFLEIAAKEKFCRANTDAPGSQCALKCSPFNPQAQTSAQVCEWIGTQNWLDTKNQADMGGNFPQTAMLNPLSPVYMNRCPMICDGKAYKEISADDVVVNTCIDNGVCGETLMELAYYAVKNGIPVTNPKMQKLIEYAKIDKPFNPNVISQISKEYGVSTTEALSLLQEPGAGTSSPETPAFFVQKPAEKKPALSRASTARVPTSHYRKNFYKNKEPYTPVKAAVFTSNKVADVFIILAIVAAIVAALILVKKQMDKQ